MANKKLIYTVLTNGYDVLKKANVYSGFDYWCFTDDKTLKVQGWEMKYIEREINPIKQQRRIKILSHEYTKGYDLTIYHDSNIELISSPNDLINHYYKGGLMKSIHQSRKNIEDEAKKVIQIEKDTEINCKRTLDYAKEINFKDDLGLWESGIMIRDKSKEVQELETVWNELVQEYSHRDQLTIPIACHITGFRIQGIKRAVMYSYFKLNSGHIGSGKRVDFNVWYSNPWSSDLNIGGAINRFCRLIENPNDWIVIQDGDICYITSDWGKRVKEALQLDGTKFGLVGCYTNRIKETRQCNGGKFSDDMNMRNHNLIANSYIGSGIEPIEHGIAGFFMAFKKSTFDLVGGFQENSISFDTIFNVKVREKGLKLGLIRSLYVWHSYRLWASDPWSSDGKKHLMKNP
jgi:hypothetical protein